MSVSSSNMCDPVVNDNLVIYFLDAQGKRQFTTEPSESLGNCISPSFVPLLKEMIPGGEKALEFGGSWFWSSYFHALSGEDILVDLSGTGVSLSEDSLDSQVALRRKLALLSDKRRFGAPMEHCCSKIEILCAMCLSLVMHISQQPMLESEQGPQALVLCATKDQCDEVYSLLDRFGTALHLVTHNLFGAYPPMPTGKRADIVVGTLPLWERVAQLTPLAINDGLEAILHQVSDNSRCTASLTLWRPYSLGFIVQLIFVDLELQHALGYEPMLRRLFLEHKRSALLASRQSEFKNSHKIVQGPPASSSELPQSCQLYCLLGRHKNGKELFYALRDIRDRRGDGKNKRGLTCIALNLAPVCHKVDIDRNAISSRKRRRDDEDTESSKTASNGNFSDECPRLFVHNALSHSRLMLDATAFEDFAAEMRRRAWRFWSSFESTSSSTIDTDDVQLVIDVQLVYGCRSSEQRSNDAARLWSVAETVAVITPTGESAAFPSRTALLMRHLEDGLSGQIFDGSVVQCSYQCVKIDQVAPNFVALHAIFAETASLISQKLVFMRLADAGYEKIGRVKPDCSVADALSHRVCLRQLAVAASSSAKKTLGFPQHTFLPTVACVPWCSVLAFRRIAQDISLFCDSQNGAKPTALLFLEECCQYGKVVSYFVHEQSSCGESCGCTVNFFVEFETCEGATEAVRQFSLRFMSNGGEVGRQACVKLFPNESYYEGVVVEMKKKQECTGDTDLESNSEDDFISVSLLAE